MKKNQNNIPNATSCSKNPAVNTGGKKPGRLIAAFVAAVLLFAVFAGCKHDSDGPLKKPTKTTYTTFVSASFPTYNPGQTTLNLTPTYTSLDWGKFSQSDITYIVTAKDSSDTVIQTYTTGFDNITIASGPYSFDTYTFTMTFKYGNTIIGEQNIKIDVITSFQQLQNSEGGNNTILSVPITLSKTE